MTKPLSTAAAVALTLGAAGMAVKADSPAIVTGVAAGDAPATAKSGCSLRHYVEYNGRRYAWLHYRCD